MVGEKDEGDPFRAYQHTGAGDGAFSSPVGKDIGKASLKPFVG